MARKRKHRRGARRARRTTRRTTRKTARRARRPARRTRRTARRVKTIKVRGKKAFRLRTNGSVYACHFKKSRLVCKILKRAK